MKATGPLAGLRVLDMTQFILGPLATQILGDMGADVIKVEPPTGDPNRQVGPSRHPGMATLYLGMNRNKRSVVLDLKQPADMDILMQMVDHADVFVHSLKRNASQRLGVDYPSISRRNPRIIHACAPGYRSDGPLRNQPAYDDVIQGESGIVDMNFLNSGVNRYLPTVLADKFCGHALASAIAMALYHRSNTGEGQSVEVPMLETMLSFNLVEHLSKGAFDAPREPAGYERALMAERRPAQTLDGGFICWLAAPDEQWTRMFKAFERDDLLSDPRFATAKSRSECFPVAYAAVAEMIGRHTTADARARLDAAGIPNSLPRRLKDLDTDPYLVETEFFQPMPHPVAGPMVTPDIPVKFSRSPAQLRRPPPCLGEHTEEVLAELGIKR